MLPVAEDAEAAEAAHLTVDEVLCKGLTGIVLRIGMALWLSRVLLMMADSMACRGCPSWEHRACNSRIAWERTTVLERLIECVAHVDIAVENGGPSCRAKRGLPSFFLSSSW